MYLYWRTYKTPVILSPRDLLLNYFVYLQYIYQLLTDYLRQIYYGNCPHEDSVKTRNPPSSSISDKNFRK